MGRPCGYVMSDAQKQAMAEGRKRAYELRHMNDNTVTIHIMKKTKVSKKAKNTDNEDNENITRGSNDIRILGYSYPEPSSYNSSLIKPYVVLACMKDEYRGKKIYKSPEEAMIAYNKDHSIKVVA